MDSIDLEREKGITIMAKNTAVLWNDLKINIVDTPGHADFGGEVERILKMVNGVIVLVDAAEGPLPQTRFVLRKSLNLGYRPIVVVNKIDRKDARPDTVLNEIFDLFVDLNATDEQLDFPVLYAVGKDGTCKRELEDPDSDLTLLFDLIRKHVPEPEVEVDRPFKMLVSQVDWNDYVGRIAIGRVEQGKIRVNQEVTLLSRTGETREKGKATKLFTFMGLKRVPVDEVEAGDIIALAGYNEVMVGDTLTDSSDLTPIPYYDIDEPTLAMFFRVNNSPFVGREGEFVTANMLSDRLMKEARTNVSIWVQPTESPDVYRVSGRGELQLAILIETMRREGYEFAVSRPEVIIKEIDGKRMEPVEEVIVDVQEEYSNKVIDKLQQRKGLMQSMIPEGDHVRLTFHIPTRGLIGMRGELLTDTRGMAQIHQQFHAYEPYKGDIPGRNRGALVALENGMATGYALENAQDRGEFLVEPGDPVYMGQVIGLNTRSGDLVINIAKKKSLTNHRASQSQDAVKISVARKLSLEEHIEFIDRDELVEVTPKSLRIRKVHLDHNERKRKEK